MQKRRIARENEMKRYRPNVGGDEDDDGEGAEPGVTNSEENVARNLRAGEVPQREKHHARCQRQRDQVKHPHLSLEDDQRDGSKIGFWKFGNEDHAALLSSSRMRTHLLGCATTRSFQVGTSQQRL